MGTADPNQEETSRQSKKKGIYGMRATQESQERPDLPTQDCTDREGLSTDFKVKSAF